jgi:hypothetical protein
MPTAMPMSVHCSFLTTDEGTPDVVPFLAACPAALVAAAPFEVAALTPLWAELIADDSGASRVGVGIPAVALESTVAAAAVPSDTKDAGRLKPAFFAQAATSSPWRGCQHF